MEISQTAAGQLFAWYSRKPIIALMGEYSAGKSTLLNLLLDGEILPTKVTATNLPAVWLTYGEEKTVEGLRHDGTLECVDMDSLGEDVREQYLLLRFAHDAEILKQVDVVDTPGISDPKLAKGATLYLADYLDAVLWLSPANQAWRQSEKTVWTAFPETLRADSLMVMTRADKMRRVSDLNKVLKRVKSETKDLFGAVLAMNTPLAKSSKSQPESKDWEKCGGKAFYAALETLIQNASDAQLLRTPVELVEEIHYAEDENLASEVAEASVLEVQTVEATAEEIVASPDIEAESANSESFAVDEKADDVSAVSVTATGSEEETPDWLITELSNCGKTVQNFDQIVSKFEHLRAKLDMQSSINPTRRFVMKQCLTAGDNAEANVERLLEQAKLELTDFEKDSWCVIARGAP